MHKTLRAMLDEIDAYLAHDSEDALALWDVLTALRGPDRHDNYLKQHTTCVIRTAAFPRTAERDSDTYGTFAAHDKPFACPDPYNEDDHFQHHVYRAADALRLGERGDG